MYSAPAEMVRRVAFVSVKWELISAETALREELSLRKGRPTERSG